MHFLYFVSMLQVLGKVPTISIDKTDGCQMFLSKESLQTEIITAKSSEMNVMIPNGDEFVSSHFHFKNQIFSSIFFFFFRLNNQFRNNSRQSSKALNYPLLARNPFRYSVGLIFMMLCSSFCNQERRPIISQKMKSENNQFKSLLSL